MLVSPLVIREEQLFAFNFWFNGSVRCGMYHQGELYCRLESFAIQKRPHVYQLGCKLAQHYTAIVLSSSTVSCSLWISLRHPSIGQILLTADASSLLDTMLRPQADVPLGDRLMSD